MKTVIRPETEMKDSGIDTVEKMPLSWNKIRLKNLVKIRTGNEDTKNATPNGKYRFYVRSPIVERCDRYTFEGEAILVAGDGAGAGRIFHLVDGRYAVHQRVYCLSDFKYNAKFIHYYLENLFPFEMDKGSAQSTVPSMRLPMLLNFKIVLPGENECLKIIDYLDETCSKIDEIIAEAKASIDEYKELKQSVIFETVTKGLDKNVEMKDSGVKAIGKVNNKYNVAKIAELNDGLTDGTHGTYERFDSGKLLLSSKNVQHNGLVIGNNESYISEEDSNSIVANGFPQKNDLLLCCIGASIGRCILYPFDYPIAFQRSVIFIRCNKWILPKMMMYNLQSTSSLMQEQMVVNVSAQAGLYQGLVKQLYVMVPPIGEQEKIILFLDKKTAEIDSLITEKESLIKDLESYKKSLIYEVVTGKRRVV